MSGCFIVFDGGPGSGKGTMIRKAFEYIYGKSKKYDNILVTDEPTNGPYGKRVRELFKQQKSPEDFKEEIFQAFVDDRAWHIKEIISPSLEKNFVVICDRYKYSSIVYQTVQGNEFDKVFNAHKDFLPPTLSIILDVDPITAHNRINLEKSDKRKQSDNFRELDFITNLRKRFLLLPAQLPKENIVIIDANKPINEVFESIKPYLDKALF